MCAIPVDPLLVVILGPTASGKSALAIHLAEGFSGEVISCDSVAVYRNFEIGTAKPSANDRARVRHHLIDVAEPGEPFTAGEYVRRARAALEQVSQCGHLPIVVGGTGLYLRALLEGLFPGPQRSDQLRGRLRACASERGSIYLHRLLQRLDPASASAIHPNDASKLIRALEVCLAAGRPMSELWQQERDPLRGFRILRLGLNPAREELYDRINRRAARMFDDGLVAETQSLLERYGDARGITPIRSLGYQQALQYLRGELTLAQAIAAAQQGHRNYAKRQMTWFRREPGAHWLDGFGDDPAIRQQAVARIDWSSCEEHSDEGPAFPF
jgi:tRNA dimethylallyltransferase